MPNYTALVTQLQISPTGLRKTRAILGCDWRLFWIMALSPAREGFDETNLRVNGPPFPCRVGSQPAPPPAMMHARGIAILPG